MEYLFTWIIIAVIALAIDYATSNFFFICFTFGGLGAIIAMMLHGELPVQIITFAIVSGVSIAIIYPFTKKYIKKSVPKTLTTEQSYVGRIIIIDTDVEEKASIKIDGIYWTVKNDGEVIKAGDRAEITGIQGNKLTIKKIK